MSPVTPNSSSKNHTTENTFNGRIRSLEVEEKKSTIKVLVEKFDHSRQEFFVDCDHLERLIGILFNKQLIGNFVTETRNEGIWLKKLSVKTEEIW